MDSLALGFDTRSSVRAILGDAAFSPPTGPECPSTTMSALSLSENQRGELQYRLTEEQKQEATRLYESGESIGMIAERYEVSRQSMWDVLRRRTKMRNRIDALPRKPTSAIRAKRAATLKRYRERAARITAAQTREVWARDKACVKCKEPGEQIDHIYPVALGGSTSLENLQLLCRPCHITKTRADLALIREVMPSEASRGSSISSVEASRDRARTSASPGSAEGSPEHAPGSSRSSPESLSLFDPDGFSSRTFRVSSLATAVGTSESSLPRWPTSGTAWPGGLSTHASSECRSDAGGCSSSEPSLSEILEPPQSVPAKYSLSARAASGILRRAEKRGRRLPGHLAEALESVAGPKTPSA